MLVIKRLSSDERTSGFVNKINKITTISTTLSGDCWGCLDAVAPQGCSRRLGFMVFRIMVFSFAREWHPFDQSEEQH